MQTGGEQTGVEEGLGVRGWRDRFIRAADWLSDRIVPNLLNSQYSYKARLETLVDGSSAWLDVGCGHDIIPAWLTSSGSWQRDTISRASIVVGVDPDLSSLLKHQFIQQKVQASTEALPFRDESFSLITMNMVAEHLQNPIIVFREIVRVLKPGGLLLVHTPNVLNYRSLCAMMIPRRVKLAMIKFFEDREEQDVFPTFYRVNSGRAIRRAANGVGLKVIEIRYVETNPVASVLGPLVIPELLYLRLLRSRFFRKLRGVLIAELRKDSI